MTFPAGTQLLSPRKDPGRSSDTSWPHEVAGCHNEDPITQQSSDPGFQKLVEISKIESVPKNLEPISLPFGEGLLSEQREILQQLVEEYMDASRYYAAKNHFNAPPHRHRRRTSNQDPPVPPFAE
jgi:hypothetical protein